MEKKGYVSKHQNGLRRGGNTVDPVLCREHEVRKAQANKESAVAVFFDIEKVYDMMCGEGLLIKLCKMGSIYRWMRQTTVTLIE